MAKLQQSFISQYTNDQGAESVRNSFFCGQTGPQNFLNQSNMSIEVNDIMMSINQAPLGSFREESNTMRDVLVSSRNVEIHGGNGPKSEQDSDDCEITAVRMDPDLKIIISKLKKLSKICLPKDDKFLPISKEQSKNLIVQAFDIL